MAARIIPLIIPADDEPDATVLSFSLTKLEIDLIKDRGIVRLESCSRSHGLVDWMDVQIKGTESNINGILNMVRRASKYSATNHRRA